MTKEENSEKISITNESHLYLHPGESLAVALVSHVLDLGNYHSWSRSMLTALSAKNKLQFVNGVTVEPKNAVTLCNAWTRCNNMVVSWLVHSISPQIRQYILWLRTLKRYGKTSRFGSFKVIKLLAIISQN